MFEGNDKQNNEDRLYVFVFVVYCCVLLECVISSSTIVARISFSYQYQHKELITSLPPSNIISIRPTKATILSSTHLRLSFLARSAYVVEVISTIS